MKAYSVSLFPSSWRFDVQEKSHKKIWGFGPLRFTLHNIRQDSETAKQAAESWDKCCEAAYQNACSDCPERRNRT